MSVRSTLIVAALLSGGAHTALAQEQEQGRYELYRRAPGWGWSDHHATSRGPVGVRALGLTDGELRVQATYGSTEMGGLRDRTSNISNEEAFSTYGYGYVPNSQSTDTYMIEVGYGVTESLTVSLDVPYYQKEMDSVTSTGTEFRTSSSGVGDLQLWAHNRWFAWGSEQAFWSLGLGIPTGSFDKTDVRPGSAGPVVLPYSMQLGSGTYDLTGMMSWLGYSDRWSWGGTLLDQVRLFGPNDRRYTLGSYQEISLWGGRELTPSLITTLRAKFFRLGDVHGQDPALDQSLSPAEHPNQQKVKRLDITAGLNFYQGSGTFEGLRMGLEIGFPAWQQLRGPQLKTEYFGLIGLQWTF